MSVTIFSIGAMMQQEDASEPIGFTVKSLPPFLYRVSDNKLLQFVTYLGALPSTPSPSRDVDILVLPSITRLAEKTHCSHTFIMDALIIMELQGYRCELGDLNTPVILTRPVMVSDYRRRKP